MSMYKRNFSKLVMGIGAITLALGINFGNAFNDYGIRTNTLSLGVLAVASGSSSDSGSGDSGSGSGSGSGGSGSGESDCESGETSEACEARKKKKKKGCKQYPQHKGVEYVICHIGTQTSLEVFDGTWETCFEDEKYTGTSCIDGFKGKYKNCQGITKDVDWVQTKTCHPNTNQ